MGDDLFQQRFNPNHEPDSVRASPSTTYSFMANLEEHRDGMQPPDSPPPRSYISRKPLPRGQLSKSSSISESIRSDYLQGNTLDSNSSYADGFTEFHSPTFQSRRPSFNVGYDETGSGKQPQIGDPTSWPCPKCTFRNTSDTFTCGVCEFRRTLDQSSDKISIDDVPTGFTVTPSSSIRRQNSFPESITGSDYKEAVRFGLPTLPEVVVPSLPEVMMPSLPEVVPPSFPEVVPEITSGLELAENAPQAPASRIAHRPKPMTPPTDAQIITKDSDAHALALITTREPPPPPKTQPKKTISIKRISRSIMSSNKKSESSETPRSDPDVTSGGHSLVGLAELLGNAIEAGNLPLVASLLKLGADVNYSSVKKKTYHYAATRAIVSNHDHIVEYLLSKGMDQNSTAHALRQAIIRGNSIDISMNLVPHADLNHMFAVKGDGDKIQESCFGALSRMNNVGNQDRIQLLRLMMQQPKFDADNPAMLLDSPSEKVALSLLSCFTQQAGLAAVESLLLELGDTYKIPRQKRYGSPYIHVDPLACISVKYWQREPKQALEIAQLLLKHGSRITGVEEKYTPLVPAIVAGCLAGVQLLLDNGADPECPMSTVGWSTPLPPLSYAAQERSINIEICRALIFKGARPWRSDKEGRTALYWACRGGNMEAVRYLFQLDVARSNINKCLEAAFDTYNPEVAQELVNIGAYATAATWKYAMSAKPFGDRRNTYLEIIDILLTTKTKLERDLVLAAIDHQNFWGLSRILENRNGTLDFDKDAMFTNPRWSGIVCRTNSTRPTGLMTKKYGWGTRRDLQTCLAYAEERNAHDIVALLQSHDWESRAECEPDCGLKLWDESCMSTPPHRVHNGYAMEVAGARKTSI